MRPVARPEAETGPALLMGEEPAPVAPPGLNEQV